MDFVDIKYIGALSIKLDRFKKKADYHWNFRCPYCGDSQKSLSKARGHIIKLKDDLLYKCHNCSVSTSIPNLIKFVDSNIYSEYMKEKLINKYTSKRVKRKKEPLKNIIDNTESKLINSKFLNNPMVKRMSDLKGHPAQDYLKNRGIPESCYDQLFFVSRFYNFSDDYLENSKQVTDQDKRNDHPRLIIPFFDEKGNIFGYQGRAFGKENPKYVTIMIDKSQQKIFGLNRINEDNPILVTEGPIDSLFLENSVSTCQSDLRIEKYKYKSILVPDNEPRNFQIVRQVEKFIDDGYKVCVWNDQFKEKDINDMVLGGHSPKEIQEYIIQNSYRGLEAKTKFNHWKRI